MTVDQYIAELAEYLKHPSDLRNRIIGEVAKSVGLMGDGRTMSANIFGTIKVKKNVIVANGHENDEYQFGMLARDKAPVIASMQTARAYVLPWDKLVHLAIEAGIDEPQNDADKPLIIIPGR